VTRNDTKTTLMAAACACSLALLDLACFKPVALRLHLDEPDIVAPGKSRDIGVCLIDKEGKEKCTKGLLGGTLDWDDLRVQVTHGEFSRGRLRVASDLPVDTESIEIQVRLKGKSQIELVRALPISREVGLEIFPLTEFRKSPGTRIPLGTLIRYESGAEWRAESENDRPPCLAALDIDLKGMRLDGGDLVVDEDAFSNPSHQVQVVAASRRNPSLSQTFAFRLDYVDQYTLAVNGGRASCCGADGKAGHDLLVDADSYFDPVLHTQLLKIRARGRQSGREWHYLVDARAGGLTLISNGGDGADGVAGNDGQPGTTGSDGREHTRKDKDKDGKEVTVRGPGQDGGDGRPGENGGNGGRGGDGGDVLIRYTKAFAPYMDRLDVRNAGGVGGRGGAGGSGGRGGSGGSGHPDGRSGSDGVAGLDGRAGQAGLRGSTSRESVDAIAW
jgi:hypothetical protein